MRYYANPCTPDVVAAMMRGELGVIDTPAQGNVRPPGVEWCADNGAFGAGYPGDAGLLQWLATHPERELCAFATAPDVVGDHQRTYQRSDPMLEPIQALGYRVAFVIQNGSTPGNVPWSRLDAIFVGGDTAWKLGAAARSVVGEARDRGKWVHMGRVNSHKRLRYASAIGCDSVDGTYLRFGPDANLPRLLRFLGEVDTQGALDLGVF